MSSHLTQIIRYWNLESGTRIIESSMMKLTGLEIPYLGLEEYL